MPVVSNVEKRQRMHEDLDLVVENVDVDPRPSWVLFFRLVHGNPSRLKSMEGWVLSLQCIPLKL